MQNKCYECEYRGTVPGDAHSCCKHPLAEQLLFLAGPLLNIIGDPHGIRSGWFLWPLNFDPTWLKNCNGFKGKEPEKKIDENEKEIHIL